MDLVNLLISVVSGAVGGNVAGAAAPDKSLGTLGNSVAGLLGGGAGTYLMQALGVLAQAATTQTATGGSSLDIANIIGTIASSGVGGAAVTFIVGLIKNAMDKK